MTKNFKYLLEYFLLAFLFIVFRIMPISLASATGGLIGRVIGPKLAASRKAYRNISLALPEKNEEQKREIIRGMWENLGRVIAEYPHLKTIAEKYTTVEGLKHLQSFEDNACVFLGAHIANWELYGVNSLIHLKKPIILTYRAPNNPYVAKLLNAARTLNGKIEALPKAASSGRHIINALKNKKSIGILIDQKYNEGLNIPFFNHGAMTNPVFVELAQRFDTPLIFVRIIRHNKYHCKIIIEPPIKTENGQKEKLDKETVMRAANEILEKHINEFPEQWLWLHRRWPHS